MTTLTTTFALAASSAGLVFAGTQSIGFGEMRLGMAELVISAVLAVWASLVRG